MKKRQPKKLEITRETLRRIAAPEDLHLVVGMDPRNRCDGAASTTTGWGPGTDTNTA